MKKLWILLLLALLSAVSAEAAEPVEAEPAGYVALTFDDGPSGPITERLLDGLKERGVHATFFLCGYRMEEYPAPLPRYLTEGHELGVHSTVHADLTRLSPGDLHRDLEGTARAIEAATGVRPTLLRPPGGAYNEAVLEAAEAKGLPSRSEVFADRGYRRDGTLVPRSQPGALITDEDEAIARVIRMVRDGVVTSVDGVDVPLRAESICVHGDGEKALLFVRRIRKALEEAGIEARA